MEHQDTSAQVSGSELDDALARAIRLLISGAIESGAPPDPRRGADR